MKVKCPTCGIGKARRLCRRADNVEICSECCASIRDADCGDCDHFASAQQYEEHRLAAVAGFPAGDFTMEISPDVSDAVSEALETALRGGFRSAMDTLNTLLHDHPRHHDVPYGIGVVHGIKGEHEESIAWFDRAIAINLYSVESYFNRAVAYQKLLDMPNCLRSYQRVVAIGPASDPEVAKARSILDTFASKIRRSVGIGLDAYLRAGDKFNEAFALMERDNWNGALKGFRASAALNDSNAPCHGNMGLCLAHLGHKAQALAELDRALELDPGYQPARSNRKVVEKMIEGRPLENPMIETVNFSKDSFLKNQ